MKYETVIFMMVQKYPYFLIEFQSYLLFNRASRSHGTPEISSR
jgi:hypothetical protein